MRPLEASEIAEREAGAYDCIVAAGGDGTVHEVVNGLLRSGAGTALGVLPLGSGDDFAKLLAVRDAVDRLATPECTTVDAGRLVAGNEVRYFANGMDIGFGAHVARNLAAVPRFATGLGAYLWAIGHTMIRYPALELRLQADDGPWRAQPATLVAVMNGRSFGGSFRIAPMAIPQDGLLDVVIAERVTRRRILQLVPRLMRGSHLAEPDIHSFQARRLVVEAARPVLFEMDGELPLPPALRLEIEILPRALRMLS